MGAYVDRSQAVFYCISILGDHFYGMRKVPERHLYVLLQRRASVIAAGIILPASLLFMILLTPQV